MNRNLSLQSSLFVTFGFALMLWLIKAGESMLSVNLVGLGVYPQVGSGLVGVVTAPLIHGSWQHLFNNTLPILVLGTMLIYGYPKSRWWVLSIVWLVSGLGVWFFARVNFHVGASGLTHGVFFYLLVAGVIRRDKQSTVLLAVAFFMYGTMIWSIFPQGPGISFEYHLFGALSGVVCAVLFRTWDPKPLKKRYSWEQDNPDSVEEDDPIIGDQWKLPEDNAEPEVSSRVF